MNHTRTSLYQVQVYRDPYKYSGFNVYQSPLTVTSGPSNRFATAVGGDLKSEPLLQAVNNPFESEKNLPLVEAVHTDHDDKIVDYVDDEPEPGPEPVSASIIVKENLDEIPSIKLDSDDPFEPEAEVDLENDFLPSINPLANNFLPQPSVSLPQHSIIQTLELLPPSFLENIRKQREFEESVANLREFSRDSIGEHKQVKREKLVERKKNEDDEDIVESRDLFSDASFNKDKIHAYNIYKNQWTTSGNKKLVVDASKALQRYYADHQILGASGDDRHISHFDVIDIDNSLFHQTERDSQHHTHQSHNHVGNKIMVGKS